MTIQERERDTLTVAEKPTDTGINGDPK